MNAEQTEFGQNVSFEMRTFRFITAGSTATDAQEQTIACDLHLEPIADVSTSQPDDCTCFTQAACAIPGQIKLNLSPISYGPYVVCPRD